MLQLSQRWPAMEVLLTEMITMHQLLSRASLGLSNEDDAPPQIFVMAAHSSRPSHMKLGELGPLGFDMSRVGALGGPLS
jgi:hypothetical protein